MASLLDLRSIEPPGPDTSWADAMASNYGAISDYIARQRAESARRGLWDDAGGRPTGAGLLDVVRQYGSGLLMGTMAPEGSAFRQWFGRSVYADANGAPVPMYHGTKGTFDEFRVNQTPDDHVPGISVTPHPEEAASYGSNVRPVYVKAENPMDHRRLDDWAAARAGRTGDADFSAFDVDPQTLLGWLREAGHDAIDYTSDPMLGYGVRVFDPAQLKPAD